MVRQSARARSPLITRRAPGAHNGRDTEDAGRSFTEKCVPAFSEGDA